MTVNYISPTEGISIVTGYEPVLRLLIGTIDSVTNGDIMMDGILDLNGNTLGADDGNIPHKPLQV